MPRRNRTPRSPRRRLPFLPPEPEPTTRQLAQRLVSRGLASAVILELTEVHTPSRQRDEANP
jgi:hypothetical protein